MSCSDNKPLGHHFCFNKRSHRRETRKPTWQGSIFWRKRYFFFLRVSQNCTLKSFQNRVEHINYQNFCLSFQNVEPVTPIGNPSPTLFWKTNMEAAKMAPPGRGSDAFWLTKTHGFSAGTLNFRGFFPFGPCFFFRPAGLPSKDPPLLPSFVFRWWADELQRG